MAGKEKDKEKESRSLAPWRSFGDLGRTEREMERMFEDFFGRRMSPLWPSRWLGAGTQVSMPAVDVYQEQDDIVVKAELPGMDKDNIDVIVSDHLLTIKGEKKKEEEVKEENYYRSERSQGSFVRTVELPADVKSDQVKATFKNGLLEIHLPKTEDAKKKEIKIKVD
jgi:HSP20 family protein